MCKGDVPPPKYPPDIPSTSSTLLLFSIAWTWPVAGEAAPLFPSYTGGGDGSSVLLLLVRLLWSSEGSSVVLEEELTLVHVLQRLELLAVL